MCQIVEVDTETNTAFCFLESGKIDKQTFKNTLETIEKMLEEYSNYLDLLNNEENR